MSKRPGRALWIVAIIAGLLVALLVGVWWLKI